MDDFINFLSQAAQTPQLALALLFDAVQQAWTPLLTATIVSACIAVAVKRWRRRHSGMELHELVIPFAAKPHASDETDLRAAELDEEMFHTWHADLIFETGIIFKEDEARKLFQIKDRARKSEVMD